MSYPSTRKRTSPMGHGWVTLPIPHYACGAPLRHSKYLPLLIWKDVLDILMICCDKLGLIISFVCIWEIMKMISRSWIYEKVLLTKVIDIFCNKAFSKRNLLHINSTCITAEKMALTLLDYLFTKEELASSNLSGRSK